MKTCKLRVVSSSPRKGSFKPPKGPHKNLCETDSDGEGCFPGVLSNGTEQGRASPIRGWGAPDDILSPSQSPVRACDRDASQAARSILDGLAGNGPEGMHAACTSADEHVDDGRMTPNDADV